MNRISPTRNKNIIHIHHLTQLTFITFQCQCCYPRVTAEFFLSSSRLFGTPQNGTKQITNIHSKMIIVNTFSFSPIQPQPHYTRAESLHFDITHIALLLCIQYLFVIIILALFVYILFRPLTHTPRIREHVYLSDCDVGLILYV